jgi:hypothetical protein
MNEFAINTNTDIGYKSLFNKDIPMPKTIFNVKVGNEGSEEENKTINKRDRIKKNVTTLAIYNALFYENRHRKKALVSITIGDRNLSSLFKLRKEFITKLKTIMKRKAFKGEKIAYFTNIEFNKDLEIIENHNPHLHIQFFYDKFLPIDEALYFLNTELNYCFKNFNVVKAKKKKAYLGYIVKDYVIANYNEEYEIYKKKESYNKPLYTASRKLVSNYVIKYIYGYFKKYMPVKWKALEYNKRYEFILEQIKEGNILIKDITDTLTDKYNIIKNKAIYIKIVE